MLIVDCKWSRPLPTHWPVSTFVNNPNLFNTSVFETSDKVNQIPASSFLILEGINFTPSRLGIHCNDSSHCWIWLSYYQDLTTLLPSLMITNESCCSLLKKLFGDLVLIIGIYFSYGLRVHRAISSHHSKTSSWSIPLMTFLWPALGNVCNIVSVWTHKYKWLLYIGYRLFPFSPFWRFFDREYLYFTFVLKSWWGFLTD